MSRNKNKIENRTRLTSYMWQLQNQLFSMFDYKNLDFRKEFLEWELQRIGFVAIGKDKDKILVGSIVWSEYDEYGLPKNESPVDFYTRYGYEFSGILGKDIVIGYNNPIRTPIVEIPFYAEMFTEIDKSIKTNVKLSRVASVPVAKDDATKTAIENILTDIEDGKTKTIASQNIMDDLLNEDKEIIKMLHLTQPEQIERVQYLSKLNDDLLKRFWNVYGHSLQSNGKMAQVSEMELEGYETYSKITPYSMLESRKELLEDCNRILGTDYSVDFGKAWEHLKEKVVSSPKQENIEESEVTENETSGILAE